MSAWIIFNVVVLFCVVKKCESDMEKSALIFGGNGFIGSEVATRLLDDGFSVTCVHRGNSYWDSDQRIGPRVTQIFCDRTMGLSNCEDFSAVNVKLWNVVIDLSAYDPNVVKDALVTLKHRTELYIYISSDSVYEVCIPKSDDAGGMSVEDDAIRPTSEEQRNELNRRESYGHRKLAGEEVIKKFFENSDIPYVILRLPDVIGPRDTTNRWWIYQMWIQFYHHIQRPIVVPNSLRYLATSYVYVKDVADVIVKIVKEKEKVNGQALNVALKETFTLEQLLAHIAAELGVPGIEYEYTDNEPDLTFFPSVSRGGVNISKVKKLLDWSPTPWSNALREITEFYKMSLLRFPNKREEIVQMLLSEVVPSQHKEFFLNAIKGTIQALKSLENAGRRNRMSETKMEL